MRAIARALAEGFISNLSSASGAFVRRGNDGQKFIVFVRKSIVYFRQPDHRTALFTSSAYRPLALR